MGCVREAGVIVFRVHRRLSDADAIQHFLPIDVPVRAGAAALMIRWDRLAMARYFAARHVAVTPKQFVSG